MNRWIDGQTTDGPSMLHDQSGYEDRRRTSHQQKTAHCWTHSVPSPTAGPCNPWSICASGAAGLERTNSQPNSQNYQVNSASNTHPCNTTQSEYFELQIHKTHVTNLGVLQLAVQSSGKMSRQQAVCTSGVVMGSCAAATCRYPCLCIHTNMYVCVCIYIYSSIYT